MNLYAFASSFAPMLRNLSALLDKGQAHAEAQGLDPNAYAEMRLAPDMFTFSQQILVACVQAQLAMIILSGGEKPYIDPTSDTTLDQMRKRIADTIALCEATPESAFEGAETRQIDLHLVNDLYLQCSGLEFLRDWALPHFYFHVTTVYDILRQQGVQLGKADYIVNMSAMVVNKDAA